MASLPNQAVFSHSSVIAEYVNAGDLFPAERILFDLYRSAYVGKHVLDIGVGAGRTTPTLAAAATSYVAIDYSLAMVRVTQGRHPHLRVLHADARDMPIFRDGGFDFVLFSYNGLDCVDHTGRLQILSEIFRVMKSGGIFMFSGHNRDHLTGRASFIRRKLRSIRDLHPVRHPLATIGTLTDLAVSLFNHLRQYRLEQRTTEYAILNDPAHRFRLMLYYIGQSAQLRQLAEVGFTDTIDIFDGEGNPATPDSRSGFLYYVARKP
jgi:ubiquinone/menaquinone biosynthesis C-methylase UbiE